MDHRRSIPWTRGLAAELRNFLNEKRQLRVFTLVGGELGDVDRGFVPELVRPYQPKVIHQLRVILAQPTEHVEAFLELLD